MFIIELLTSQLNVALLFCMAISDLFSLFLFHISIAQSSVVANVSIMSSMLIENSYIACRAYDEKF